MNKYVLGIDGMKCGMCEIHVEEAIGKEVEAKKINASHFKNNVTIITEIELTKEDFEKILEPTGYRLTSYEKGEAKKGFFGWK